MSLDLIMRQEARYIMLRALSEESDYTLSDALLERVLELYGIRRTRDFVRSELTWLADVGAVRLERTGETTIATLLSRGQSHVQRTALIDGVKRPSPPEA